MRAGMLAIENGHAFVAIWRDDQSSNQIGSCDVGAYLFLARLQSTICSEKNTIPIQKDKVYHYLLTTRILNPNKKETNIYNRKITAWEFRNTQKPRCVDEERIF